VNFTLSVLFYQLAFTAKSCVICYPRAYHLQIDTMGELTLQHDSKSPPVQQDDVESQKSGETQFDDHFWSTKLRLTTCDVDKRCAKVALSIRHSALSTKVNG